jgi:hypothetical protein
MLYAISCVFGLIFMFWVMYFLKLTATCFHK